MYKITCLLLAVFAVFFVYGQKDSLTKEEKHALDSMFKNDEFIKLMKKDKNHLDVSMGIGNAEFSVHNNAANATGAEKKIIFVPSVAYRLKNGLSVGVAGFLANNSSNNLQLYQTGLSAGYDYDGKTIAAGLSYTRYLSDKNKYNNNAIYQNDLMGYIKLAKGIIQPGITLGYADGFYKETDYVSFKRKIHLNNPPPLGRDTVVTISGNDSTENKTSYFSASANIEHDFSFNKIFSRNDELAFVPSLVLNFANDKLDQTHTDQIFNRPLFSRKQKSNYSNKFQLQSLAASLDFTYTIKKFFVQTLLYTDYYFPETTSNRLSFIFSAAVGFSF
jgi:hypothetical protein